MKKMKTGILLTVTTTLLAFMSVLYISSCNNKAPGLSPTTCENVVCQNSGYCYLGACVCPTTGYEGNRCQTKWNEKFVGKWNVHEFVSSSDNFDSVGQQRNYQLTIDTAATPSSLFLSNLRGTGLYKNVEAYIDSSAVNFHIQTYIYGSNGNFTIDGGYGHYYIKAGHDTAIGSYYTNYLNAQSFIQHDTISFMMSR
jgi:hypothetical protein